MKIRLSFKTPDVVECALEDLRGDQYEIANEAIRRYVRFGEYITVEIDIDSGEASVIPAIQ